MARIWTVLSGLVLLVALTATGAQADDPPGAKLYGTYCGACHGNEGKGGFAPEIGGKAYLDQKDDAAITQLTADGVASKGMPAWSKAKGGMLSDEQIQDIVTYLRSLSGTGTQAAAPTPVPAVAPVQTSVKTRMTLVQSTTQQGRWLVTATLEEVGGGRVSGETVSFWRQTLFGVVTLGTAKTDSYGSAQLVLDEVPQNTLITASYKANKKWETAQADIRLDSRAVIAAGANPPTRNVLLDIDEPLLEPEGSLVTPNPPLVPATLFLLVVAGIWSIYAYVIAQIAGIWRDRPTQSSHNQLRVKPR